MIKFIKSHLTATIIIAVFILLVIIWTPILFLVLRNQDNHIAVKNNQQQISSAGTGSSEKEEGMVHDVPSNTEDGGTSKQGAVSESDNRKNQNGAFASSEKSTDKNNNSSSKGIKKKNDLPELEGGATVNESPLANTYKLLTLQKKLTIGFFGGSITGGSSAKKEIRNGTVISEDGSMTDSYVNRVSDWFREKYPEATIETVNSGVSDTHSQFGLYRLESTLMNTNGHDMPDLVFIEFTTNDWIYGEHTKETVKTEVESLVVNIRKINPYADIVMIATNISSITNSPVKQAHKEIADYYGLPFIDVGTALQQKKTARGAASESAANGTLYYTTDNLHPSATGFSVYLQTITPVLKQHLDRLELQSQKLYNYKDHSVSALSQKLIKPKMISANQLSRSGKVTYMPSALTVSMYGTAIEKATTVRVADSYVTISKGGSIQGSFSGNHLGVLLSLSSKDMELQYQIDGGSWETFSINSGNLSHQKYPHAQAFYLKGGLSDGKHTVTIKTAGEGTVTLGALLTAE